MELTMKAYLQTIQNLEKKFDNQIFNTKSVLESKIEGLQKQINELKAKNESENKEEVKSKVKK